MKAKTILAVLLLAASTALQAQTAKPSWETLNQRPYPQWFSDAKLGIFIHWGLYSVPAYAGKEGYGEWFYRGLMTGVGGRKEIMSLYADTTLAPREMYAQLADHWHAELWKPEEWARMFKDAGARYVVLVTKHHDGYCLWDSPQQPEWNSTVSGPRRNIVAELTDAVRREGLTMGFYFSLPEWNNPLHVWTVDPNDSIGRYVDEYMVPQFKDLVSRYRPELIFADGDWDFTPEQLRSVELIDWYYRTVGPRAIVNDRWGHSVGAAAGVPGSGTRHGFRTPEYSAGIADNTRPWAECRGIGRSFGLNRNEDLANYLTDRELIQHFCELVAHGGGMTLNVGPAADGHIPFIQQERLSNLGKWLKVNGEAIYGTRPYTTPGGVMVPCQRTSTTAAMPATNTIDYNWVRNAPLGDMPVDNFTIEWTGEVQVPATQEYIVRVSGDDEVSVFTEDDGELLLHYRHDWAENPQRGGRVTLERGSTWPLRVKYREGDLEATVSLTWSRDGGKTFEPVPANWKGTASWQRTTRCFTQKGGDVYIIEFERPGQQLVIEGMPLLPKKATLQMLGTSAQLKWKQKKDGRLTIDLSTVDTKELNALEHAWVIRVRP